MKPWLVPVAALLLICPRALPQAPLCPPPPAHISVARGSYSSQPGIVFELRDFAAVLQPLGKTAPACYNKLTVVSHADIFVSDQSMTNLFAAKLTDSAAQIRDLRIDNNVGQVTLSGTITRLLPIHFSLSGPVSTDGSAIRMDVKAVKADGIPMKDLLKLLGEHLASVMNLKGVAGLVVDDNSISISPEQVAHLKGHLADVVTSAEGITLHYRAPQRLPHKDSAAARATPAVHPR